jgi:hypothetical protein
MMTLRFCGGSGARCVAVSGTGVLVGNMAGFAFAEVAVPMLFAAEFVPEAFPAAVVVPGELLMRISAHE